MTMMMTITTHRRLLKYKTTIHHIIMDIPLPACSQHHHHHRVLWYSRNMSFRHQGTVHEVKDSIIHCTIVTQFCVTEESILVCTSVIAESSSSSSRLYKDPQGRNRGTILRVVLFTMKKYPTPGGKV